MASELYVVAGAGGFIGGHLVADLLRQGRRVRAVDIKPYDDWWQRSPQAENLRLDLRLRDACDQALDGASIVYNLACNMGGMGFITTHRAECMLSVLVNTHLLLAARKHSVRRYFFSSSACAYNIDKQQESEAAPLSEEDAYPANPEDGYGWEKLFSERMCRHFLEDFSVQTRVARYHPIYGTHGTWQGGREKAPAAMCRKIIHAKATGHHQIEIWGDGSQSRTFLYVDDCLRATQMLMNSDLTTPANIGATELVTIDQLVDIVEDIAEIKVRRLYNPHAPRGVQGRNSDNSLIERHTGWRPSISLREGLERTYAWIHDQYHAAARRPLFVPAASENGHSIPGRDDEEHVRGTVLHRAGDDASGPRGPGRIADPAAGHG
jgi:GDP-D-mannose 3', 5'-epimerase